MKNGMIALIGALVACVVLAAAAVAGKPGPGSSTGTGSVFVSNPVQSLGDESLTDQKDSDAAVPASAYYNVKLTNLDGSGFLSGDYATVISETGNPAYSPTNTFTYTRHQDEFEQTMAYYWITEAQKYIHSLGFGETPPRDQQPPAARPHQPVGRRQLVRDRPSEERAALRQGRRRRRGGRGGDPPRVRPRDPLLAELLVRHGRGRRDQRGLRRLLGRHGLGRRRAARSASRTWSRCRVSPTGTRRPTRPAVPHCLRRVDLNLHYPENMRGEVHADGQIWSRALWDIRQSLGNVKADTVILQGSFDFDGSSFATLANSTVAAAQQIYGTATANAVKKAFADRGIL